MKGSSSLKPLTWSAGFSRLASGLFPTPCSLLPSAGGGRVHLFKNDQQAIAGYYKQIFDFIAATDKEAANSVLDYLNSSEQPATSQEFIDKLLSIIEGSHSPLANDADFIKSIDATVQQIYNDTRFKPGANVLYVPDDFRIMAFATKVDTFFFSSYITNQDYTESMTKFLEEEYKQNGIDLWGRAKPETIVNFRDKFLSKLVELSDNQVQRIINTSVQSMRNLGEIMQMRTMEVETVEIFEAMEMRACSFCRIMHGKVFKTKSSISYIDKVVNMTPDQYLNHLKKKTSFFLKDGIPKASVINTTPMDEIVANGYGLPPYHPNCKGRVIKHREVVQEVDGSNVNVSETGNILEFYNSQNDVTLNQTVKFTILDKYGQKIYVTDEGYGHIEEEHPGYGKKVQSVIRNGKIMYPNPNDPDKFYYMDNHGRQAVVFSDGNKVVWTCFKKQKR